MHVTQTLGNQSMPADIWAPVIYTEEGMKIQAGHGEFIYDNLRPNFQYGHSVSSDCP